jgi:hypothetical protein
MERTARTSCAEHSSDCCSGCRVDLRFETRFGIYTLIIDRMNALGRTTVCLCDPLSFFQIRNHSAHDGPFSFNISLMSIHRAPG